MSRFVLCLLITAAVPFAGLWAESTPPGGDPPRTEADGQGSAVLREESNGERETRALARAYPARIAEVARKDGDWAVRIDDTWYYWAHGRMLPEELRAEWESYASYRFYAYSLRLPPVPSLDEEARSKLEERLKSAEHNPPRRHEGFLGDLYRAHTRGETERRVRSVGFLGHEVSVHEDVVEPLAAVERTLSGLMSSNGEVRAFVGELKGFAGYNWRPIAGTRSRSYHSYGIAIDLVPTSYRGLHVYWRWAMPQEEEWYSIPYERRWMVPEAIVRAFEEQGFIWGGKWFFFDTIHFEYRPEILVLARQARHPLWPFGR
jgi:hypothetical protein